MPYPLNWEEFSSLLDEYIPLAIKLHEGTLTDDESHRITLVAKEIDSRFPLPR